MRLIFILFLSSLAHADPGIDTLGLPKYVDIVKENLPYGWWYSSFAETFGDGIKAIDEVNSTGKPKGFRIHLIWNKNHDYGLNDITKIIKLSKKIELIAKKYPNIKCEISPFCEHNLKETDSYLNLVERYAPSCTAVNTIWKGEFSNKYKNEIHGSGASIPSGRFNWSSDGEDSFIKTDRTQFHQAEVFWLWTPKLNGKNTTDDTTELANRKEWISRKEFLALIDLL